jgi:hypothetical protein
MKNKLLFLAGAFLPLAMLLASFSGNTKSYPGGAPAGYTGSPGDGQNCTACHGGSASTVAGWITSNIPPAGYTPGSTYTITATALGSGTKGFEVSPQDPAGNLLGTLTAGTGNHLTGSGKYVTQSSGVNSDPATWTFTWKAPAAGTGNVTFYGAFAISKSITKLSTLEVGEYVSTGIASTGSTTEITILPNPNHGCFEIAMGSSPEITGCIYDFSGRLILERKLGNGVNGIREKIDISSHPAGIYFLRLQTGPETITKKIVVY